MIGDGRNRRRSSVDTGLEPGDGEPLLGNPSSSLSSSNELSLPPGLGGLNLSGGLGLLTGLNHNSHMHHVNPLSLSMGAEDDMGVR